MVYYACYAVSHNSMPNTCIDIDQPLPELVDHSQNNIGFFAFSDFPSKPTLVRSPAPTSNGNAQAHNLTAPDQETDEIWALAEEELLEPAKHMSWDVFTMEDFEEQHTPYLTEAGPDTFDTALKGEEDHLGVGNAGFRIIEPSTFSSTLLALGLGRSSVLFTWIDEERLFQPRFSNMRVSGYTGQSIQQYLVLFLDCGATTRFLQYFVDKTYSSHTSPVRIALADTVTTLLKMIQLRLIAVASQHHTLLQLQTLFRPALSILTCFKRIVENLLATTLDEAMLSGMFEEIQSLEHRSDVLKEVLSEILVRVSQPWLEFAGQWLGLQRETGVPLTKTGASKSFVKVEIRGWIDELGDELDEPDYVLDYDKMPSFIAPEDAQALFEAGKSLRILRVHSNHPLASVDVVASVSPPTLEWKYSWEDIIGIERRALDYEKNLLAAMHTFSVDPSCYLPRTAEREYVPAKAFGKPQEDVQAYILASIDTFSQPIQNQSSDRLSKLLDSYFSSRKQTATHQHSIFSPPISLAPVLSFNPIIAAQARLVNRACMHMFFKSHNLRDHLSLQRDFHLLGNGVFSSRLSHALFDPELETAERQRGVARSGGIMGLRLAGRDSWPPASSELRLALMGVLNESYISNQPVSASCDDGCTGQNPLPGDLSFAVRNMSTEDVEKCMDPNSVEAVDFLRLVYKPPAPLEAIITPTILYKYDQLFKLLLRVVRMLYVVRTLHRDPVGRMSHLQGVDFMAQKFRIEAHHFVSSVSQYFFDTGIAATWRIFERKLDEVEVRINAADVYVNFGQTEGLHKLRDYHERVVDRIIFALLLRKRQQPIMQLLEEIFDLILKFSRRSREHTLDRRWKDGADVDVRELYLRFRKKVRVFITVCRGVSEKGQYGDKKLMKRTVSGTGGLFDGDDLGEENTISQLLSKLELSDYYLEAADV